MRHTYKEYRGIVEAILTYYHYNITYAELLDSARNKFGVDSNVTSDNYWEIGGLEFRVIHRNYIEEVFEETVKELYEDCYYSKIKNLPIILQDSFDWKKVALQVHANEGYAPTFATYDHVTLESEDYFIFRTN
jgi:hypothetical protein